MTTCSYTTAPIHDPSCTEIPPELASEEVASSEAGEILLATPEQVACTRSLSECSLSIISQAASLISQYLPDKKSTPSELLSAKMGMLHKSASLPSLPTRPLNNTHTMPLGKASSPLPQQPSTPTPMPTQEPSSYTYTPAPTPTPNSPQAAITIRVPVEPREQGEAMTTRSLTLPIPILKGRVQTARHSQETTQTSSRSAKQNKVSSKPSSTMSPLSLFSQMNKELQEKRTKDKNEGEHEQGEQQQQQEQQQKKKQTFTTEICVEEIEQPTTLYTHSPLVPDPIIAFASSTAQLNSSMRSHVSYLDVLRICAEIMKLMLKSREQDQTTRREAREALLAQAKELVDSYNTQAKISHWLGITTAALGIMGAVSPIVGEVLGDPIIEFIQRTTGLFKNATARTLFKSFDKLCSALSQLSETSSKIYELKETASRTGTESYKEISRLYQDDITRSIEETKDHWRSMDNFLLQILQTEHDSARSIYQ